MKSKIKKRILLVFTLTLPFILLFYYGFYKYLLYSASSTGEFEYKKAIIRSHRKTNIIILGDSTAAQGFRPNYFNTHSQISSINLGLGGAGLFTQHKLAEYAKKNTDVSAVVLIVGPDQFRDDNKLKTDLEYCKTSLNLLDIHKLWLYRIKLRDFLENFSSLIYRPILFGKDLRDFTEHPQTRFTNLPNNFRRIAQTDEKLYEDSRNFNVCNIGELSRLEEKVKYYDDIKDEDQKRRYETILASYVPRKNKGGVSEHAERNLGNFIETLSKEFDKVYIINAPIYSGFKEVYSDDYLNSIQNLTMNITNKLSNAVHIPRSESINSDCTNFMDVVHLNEKGGEEITKYILSYVGAPPAQAQPAKSMLISTFGPEKVQSGQGFNKQPDGSSALWVKGESITPSTVVVLNNTNLKSLPYKDGKLITAGPVPKKLFSTPGSYPIYLLDTKTGSKSNKLKFLVE